MYKDINKRREVTKERVRRYRAKAKGVTKGVTVKQEGVTSDTSVVLKGMTSRLPFSKPEGKAKAISHHKYVDDVVNYDILQVDRVW